MRRYALEIIVFVTGAAVMVFEIVGARSLAPYLGTSIFVWSAIIGVVLAGLSAGYWRGGALADQRPERAVFSSVLIIAAVSITASVMIQPFVLRGVAGIGDLRIAAVVASLCLFFLPSFFLGMVLPFAVRLQMRSVATAGITTGRLYAWSTVGSIAGTFAAGFFLIVYFSSGAILFGVAGAVALLSIVAAPRTLLKAKLAVIVVVVILAAIAVLFDRSMREEGYVVIDSMYNRIIVADHIDPETERPVRYLATNAFGVQSAMFLDGTDPVAGYFSFYRIAELFMPEAPRALLLGGGVYVFANDFLQKNPGGSIDVVEIDPMMTPLAKKYFRYPDDPGFAVFHADARSFINRTDRRYDAIYVDVFKDPPAIPFEVVTREAAQRMHDILEDNGVVVINILSAIEGKRGKVVRSIYATFRRVFPHTYLFAVDDSGDPTRVQNIILVAAKAPLPGREAVEDGELQKLFDHVWTGDVAEEDIIVLTDRRAPLEYYALPLTTRPI